MTILGAEMWRGSKSLYPQSKDVVDLKLRHKVSINISQPNGTPLNVLKGGEVRLRERLLRWLFGERKKVLVIAPGDSVFNVEIHQQDFGKLFDEYLQENIEETASHDA